MNEARDEWLRRIELYLEVGSEGVVVLVDRARDAHLGRLVRALLPKHPELSIVVSPDELRETAKGSVVIYHAEPEDAERLNLIRPVLKDRGLRVVLWARGELASELPLRAPDLYDWISHRVLCPQEGAPPFVAAGLRAAAAAERPVVWRGSVEELRAGVEDAWPGASIGLVSDEEYDALVETLASEADYVVIAPRRDELRRARWAVAEAGRHARVAIIAVWQSPFEAAGMWQLSPQQAAIGRQSDRIAAALLDLEPFPARTIQSLNGEALAAWKQRLLEASDPGATSARHLEPKDSTAWYRIAEGDAPPALLRAWGAELRPSHLSHDPNEADERWWSTLAIVDPDRVQQASSAAEVPPAIRVECALSSEEDRDWKALAEIAGTLGEHDIAVRWDLLAGSDDRALARHLGHAIAGKPTLEAMRLLERAASRFERAAPAWYESLRVRALSDAGNLREARDLASKLGDGLDVATRAYLHTFLGEWREARATLARLTPTEGFGPLDKSAIALAAWACDAARAVRPLLGPAPTDRRDESSATWTRWLSALDGSELDKRPRAEPFSDAPAEAAVSWLAAAAGAERRLDHHAATVHAARGLASVEEAFAPREHVLEGLLLMMQGRALARLGQPDRAIDKLALADTIVRRTTGNEAHPWALIARFEHAWLLARHRDGSVEPVDAALEQLERALWPEHRELRETQKLRGRLAPS